MTTTTKARETENSLPYPKGRLGKFLVKAPLLMIRLGLQPLMGDMFMVITHTGRKSGQPRHTMTEMHRAEDGQLYAPCAYGERAQWYKNIVADPHVTVQVARETFSATVRRVTDNAELLKVIDLIGQKNKFIESYLGRLGIENTPADIIDNKDKLYFITYDRTTEPTPPPLSADLKWVWIILPFLPVLVWWATHRHSA